MKRKILVEVSLLCLALVVIVSLGISDKGGDDRITGAPSLTNPDTEPGIATSCTQPSDCPGYGEPCLEVLCVGTDGYQMGYCETLPLTNEQTPAGACYDGDDCTKDLCVDGVCANPPISECYTGCRSVAECGDSTVCQRVKCIIEGTHGTCVIEHLSMGKECDGNVCTLSDYCDYGQCVPGSIWDENNPDCVATSGCDSPSDCTIDSQCPADCVNKKCVYPESQGGPIECEGDDLCLLGDYCHLGYCHEGTIPNPDCFPETGCEVDSDCPKKECKSVKCGTNGVCLDTNLEDGTICNDDEVCTIDDKCYQGTCVGEWDNNNSKCTSRPPIGGDECNPEEPDNTECTTDEGCPGEYDEDCNCVGIEGDGCPENVDYECDDQEYDVTIKLKGSYRPNQKIGEVNVLVKDKNGALVSDAKVVLKVLDSARNVKYTTDAKEIYDGAYIAIIDYKIPSDEDLIIRAEITHKDVVNIICEETDLIVKCEQYYDCDDNNDCTEDSCKRGGDCDYEPLSLKPGSCEDGDLCTLNDYCDKGSCTSGKRNPDCDIIDTLTPEENKTEEDPEEDERDDWWTEVEDGEEMEEIVEEYEEKVYTITIEAMPKKPEYIPGDTIEEIVVDVQVGEQYTDLDEISGLIDGVVEKDLELTKISTGLYLAKVDYTIASDEKSVLPIIITATVNDYEIKEVKYVLVKTKEYFEITVNSPDVGGEVVPGQRVRFEVELSNPKYPESMETANVVLIDEREGRRYRMYPGSPIYRTEFTIPKNIYDTAYFLILAETDINGTERDSAQRIMVKKSDDLFLRFDKSKQDTKTKTFALEVKYVDEDGDMVDEESLHANITGYPSNKVLTVSLMRSGDVFVGNYIKTIGDTSAEIEIVDANGNLGKASLPEEFFKETKTELPWDYVMIILIVIVICVLVYSFRSALVKKKAVKETQEASKVNRVEELRNLIKRTKIEFYKRRISEEEADRRTLEYKEELKKIKDGD